MSNLPPKGRGFCAHDEKVGTIKNGLDGNKWIVTKTSTGAHRWTKFKLNSNVSKKSSTKSADTVAKIKNKCKRFAIYEHESSTERYTQLIGLEGNVKGTIHKYISYNTFEPIATKIPGKYTKRNFKKSILLTNFIKREYCDDNPAKIYKPSDIKNIYKIGKNYLTLDHKDYTHLVNINKHTVSVYDYYSDKTYGDSDNKNYGDGNNKNYNIKNIKHIKLIKCYDTLKIFIGKSYPSGMSALFNHHGPKYDGNSFLLKTYKDKYVYIGENVYEFSIDDDIIEYYSTVTNIFVQYRAFVDKCPVQYPVAISNDNIYFMIAKKYISIDKFKEITNIKSLTNNIKYDLHKYFYNENEIETNSIPFKCKIIADRIYEPEKKYQEFFNGETDSIFDYNYEEYV